MPEVDLQSAARPLARKHDVVLEQSRCQRPSARKWALLPFKRSCAPEPCGAKPRLLDIPEFFRSIELLSIKAEYFFAGVVVIKEEAVVSEARISCGLEDDSVRRCGTANI